MISGERKGGSVCTPVNCRWGTDVSIVAKHLCPDTKLITVKIRPFFLPREFSLVIFTVTYIPPLAYKSNAMDTLYKTIDSLENKYPDAVFIVDGNFNRVNLKKFLPKFYQHITFRTQVDQMLDHCYTALKNSYKPLPRPAFGKADHSSILLLPAYKQRLKTVISSIHQWREEAIFTLQDCFHTTDWQIFQDAAGTDIEEHTNPVTDYINVCTEKIIPKICV